MNKYQIEVEKWQLENEKQILEELKNNYAKALADVKGRIKELSSDGLTQSKIYQLQYQETLERQLQAIIDLLSSDNIQSINDYLIKTYEDGFIGTLYNMQNEGVPFVMAINQDAVVKSISKKTDDFQLSKTMYKNAEELKKTLKSEITRGISRGASYSIISKKIASHSEADLKKAYRIVRTEGGRVQSEAKFECMQRAKANGADVVKEWDSTIDKRTRQSHAELDGQIQELENPFVTNGHKAMYPHNFGIAEEDINCRCVVLERARWAVNENASFTKNIDGDIVEFKNVKDYQDFKKKYFDFYNNRDTINKIEKKEKADVSYKDITDEMYKNAKPNKGKVEKQNFFDYNGKIYKVDGHNVVYKHDEREIEVARLLNKTFGGKVKILPNINFPQGVKSPDYLFRGEKTDLKRITSKRANDCVKTALKNKEEQANNFIIDNTAQTVSDDDIIKQIVEIYNSKGFLWIDKIYLLKGNNFIKVFERK